MGAAAALTPRRALDVVLQEIDAAPGALDELSIIAPAAVAKELGEVLRLRAVRAAPELHRGPVARRSQNR